MNRAVCRLMASVGALAGLAMTATLAGAQTVEVKEKPPLYRYVSYWTFPRAHWADVDKDNVTGNQKILAPALVRLNADRGYDLRYRRAVCLSGLVSALTDGAVTTWAGAPPAESRGHLCGAASWASWCRLPPAIAETPVPTARRLSPRRPGAPPALLRRSGAGRTLRDAILSRCR